MAVARFRSNLLGILFSVLLLLLLVSAGLLYRWINRASEADRQQQKEFLLATMRNFEGEFSRAIQTGVSTFQPSPKIQNETDIESHVADVYLQWQRTIKPPPLVRSLSLAISVTDDIFDFRRFQPEDRRFETQEWPTTLEFFHYLLKERAERRWTQSFFPQTGMAFALSGDRPVIVLPLSMMTTTTSSTGPDGSSSPSDQSPLPGAPNRINAATRLVGFCFLELDLEHIQEQILPTLVKRYFSGVGLSGYRLAVVTGNPQRIIYQSDPALTLAALASADAAVTLFRLGPRWGRGLFAPNGSTTAERPTETAPTATRERLPAGGAPPPDGPGWGRNPGVNSWQLVAKHELGSIEALVNIARRRNLAIGFGVLLLLGISTALLMLTAQRARSLAQRQMEFVAGVSHELRTPLAVIQSAGFNLARGVIEDSPRVREYGTMIQTEVRRLSDMVEQILSYAGIQSGRKRYEPRPTQITEIVDRALANYAAAFNEAGWQIEKKVEEELPPVLADPPVLESMIKNLIENALKYAADGKWLGISARTAQRNKKPEIQLTVEDHGPGIDPHDLPHIFDPFYRGQKVVASSVPGAGLGLSLLQRHAQAHQGRITVRSSPGGGAIFTLHLPALSPSETSQGV